MILHCKNAVQAEICTASCMKCRGSILLPDTGEFVPCFVYMYQVIIKLQSHNAVAGINGLFFDLHVAANNSAHYVEWGPNPTLAPPLAEI